MSPSIIVITLNGGSDPGPGLRYDGNGWCYWQIDESGGEYISALVLDYRVATTDGAATIIGASVELLDYELYFPENGGTIWILDDIYDVSLDGIGYHLLEASDGTTSLFDSSSFAPQSEVRVDSIVMVQSDGPYSGGLVETFVHRFAQLDPGTKPIADAGDDVSLLELGFVQLDGSNSLDPDGNAITFAWTLAAPAGSGAVLDAPTSATPGFTADLYGNYEATLIVTDSTGLVSDADSVVVGFENLPPIADAGPDQAAVVGDTVELDASGSRDANMDVLTYKWTFDAVPAGSASALINPTTIAPSFVPDQSGSYTILLVVNDGLLDSAPDMVDVLVITIEDAAEESVMNVTEAVNALAVEDFKNRNMKNALTTKINTVLAMIDNGDYQGALDKLRHDVLIKTDGCATSGSPDLNDWITDCSSQGEVYPLIMESIELLEQLV